MRSARSASRVVVDVSDVIDDERFFRRLAWERTLPWCPSLIAVVEMPEREVVVELGVLLDESQSLEDGHSAQFVGNLQNRTI